MATEENISEMLALQEKINLGLQELFDANKHHGREFLAGLLVNEVERIVEALNENGRSFARAEYSGDNDYENSEQIYTEGSRLGDGVTLNFAEFNVRVTFAQ